MFRVPGSKFRVLCSRSLRGGHCEEVIARRYDEANDEATGFWQYPEIYFFEVMKSCLASIPGGSPSLPLSLFSLHLSISPSLHHSRSPTLPLSHSPTLPLAHSPSTYFNIPNEYPSPRQYSIYNGSAYSIRCLAFRLS